MKLPERELPPPLPFPTLPVGYPLSYFARTEPFATWFRTGRSARAGQPTKGKPGLTVPKDDDDAIPAWTHDVRLEVFRSRRISRITKVEPYKGRYDSPLRPYSGAFEYIVEFSTTREIVIAVPEPKGSAAIFGWATKAGGTGARLRLRFLVTPRGHLMRLDISGGVKFRLPRTLVRPVVESGGRWVDAEVRHVVVPLGGALLTLAPGARPTLSAPLTAPAVTAQLGGSGLVVKLGAARVHIGGTSLKPRIRFTRVRLAFLRP